MGQRLPQKLVDLLREMRAAGVTVAGLMEATGLCKDTLVRYTSESKRPNRKWTVEAENVLRTQYPLGKSIQEIADEVNKLLGRDDITPRAVLVRVGQLKIIRNPGTQAKAEAIRKYWAKWRADKQICG